MRQMNLLPWREMLREENLRQFWMSLISVVMIAIGVVFALHMWVVVKINTQESNNQLLQTEINVYEHDLNHIQTLKDAEETLIAHMRVIQTMHENRIQVVQLFSLLPRLIPEKCVITRLKRVGSTLSIEGHAAHSSRVSELMHRLHVSLLFKNVHLDFLHADETLDFKSMVFRITTEWRQPVVGTTHEVS